MGMFWLRSVACHVVVDFVLSTTATTMRCSAFGVVPFALGSNNKGGIISCCGSVSNKSLWSQQKVPAITFSKISSLKRTDPNGYSDPSSWFSDTKPFTIVRFFARPEVTDDDIEEVLNANSIDVLRKLVEKGEAVARLLLNQGVYFNLASAVFTALSRVRKTAEEVLGEAKIVYDKTCLLEKCYNLYAPGAVSVSPPTFVAPVSKRFPVFSLVLGPSGSGKTMFAIRRIPQMLFGMDDTAYFRIHFRASFVTDIMDGSSPELFPKAVATIVKDVIKGQLRGKGLDDVKTLNIPIHITIDEAGGENHKMYFDMDKKIRAIVAAVKTEGTFKFQREVHVTVAGTSLEVTTTNIQTTEEQVKFRMQPWTAKNFDVLVDKSEHPHQTRVKEVVHGFPILEDLITNARCAFYVFEVTENESLLLENRLRSSVSVIVSSVADAYISNNGLAHLKNAQQKWKVVRSVFLEIDKASKNPGMAFFPQFEGLDDDQRSIASSLLDVSVETRQSVPTLLDGCDYAISMTPALAIVVANLASTEAKVSWDWQGFETTVMLSELKRMIVHSEDIPSHSDKLVLQLQSPLPAGKAKYVFSVPVVDRYTVILNGPRASYADVIAPYRLAQAKFSRDISKPFLIDLQKELNKMGLTHSPDYLMQQWITTVFCKFWDMGKEGPTWVEGESLSNSVNKKKRQVCYPFNSLNSMLVYEYPKVVGGFKTKGKWAIAGEAIEGITWPTDVDDSCPVTAVFATNCNALSFNVRRERKKSGKTFVYIDKITITQNDVDSEGIWMTSDGDEFAKLGLKDDVNIRFLFF